MGCGASVKPDYVVKLESIETRCRSADDVPEDERLTIFSECAQELSDVMDILVERGSKDSEELTRVQYLSDVILNAVDTLVDEEELAKLGDKRKLREEKIVVVGKLLDYVRATKASTLLEDKISGLQDKAAMPALMQVTKAVGAIQQPTHLADGLGKALEEMEATHKIAPASKKITDNLLKFCVQLSAQTLKFLPTILADPAACTKVLDRAKELDTLAWKLVAVMSSKWDPPLAPQVDSQVQATVKQVYEAQVGGAEASLKATGEGGVAFANLKALQPWWPHVKKLDGCPARVASLLEKVEQSANKAFEDAKAGGDMGTCEAIKGFAGEFDTLRAGFDGCAPTDGAGLKEKLSSADLVGDASAWLTKVESELPKGDLATADPNTSAILSSLEGLTAKWADASKADSSIVTRCSSACSTLEGWALSAAAKGDSTKVEGLQQFATAYDALRPQLSPPEPTDGALLPRLTATCCEGPLKMAEEELEKTDNLNPGVVLEALQKLAEIQGRPEDIALRVEAALRSCQERVVSAAEKAVEAGEDVASDKLPRLLRFGRNFDAAASKLRSPEAMDAAGDTLVQKLEAMGASDAPVAEDTPAAAPAPDPAEGADDAPADDAAAGAPEPSDEEKAAAEEHLTVIEGKLEKDTGMNPNLLLEACQKLATVWGPVSSSKDYQDRICAAYGKLRERMEDACRKAAAEDQSKKIELLLDFAKQFHTAQEALGSPDPVFLSTVARAGVDTDLSDAEAELAKESSMNTMALLKSLQNLRICWPEMGDIDETVTQFRERFDKVCATVKERMLGRYNEATTDDVKKGRLISFAGSFDAACMGLDGVSAPNLQKLLEGAT